MTVRKIGAWSAFGLAVVVFSPALSMASVGALVSAHAGQAAWLSVLVGAVGVCCVALAVVPFARRYVAGGALYTYIRHVFGDWARLLTAAALSLGYVVGMMALLGAFGLYAGSWLAGLGINGAGRPTAQAVLYCGAAGLAGLLAHRGLDTSARVSLALFAPTLPVVLVVLGAAAARDGLHLDAQLTLEGFSFGGFSQGMAAGVTFLVLFETSAATGAETRDPVRTVPRIIMAVPLVVGAANLLATVLTVRAVQGVRAQLAEGTSPLAALAGAAGLPWLAGVADAALAVSALAALVGLANYGSRVWQAMGEDGVLPARIGARHPRLGTPTAGIVAMSGVSAAALTLLGFLAGGGPFVVYRCVSVLFSYMWVIPYVLICAGAVVLLRRERCLTAVTALTATLGALSFIWLYAGAFLEPPPYPEKAMLWLCPAAIAVGFLLLVLAHRRRRMSPVLTPLDRVEVTP
ncbi:APC family permease [Streptomyces catenulae]|uniref:APC family permease n=1 Tax=Streptomyces catenulae TaxID=66875 RepID=A0ABV2Z4G9_9ACTN|nr:APC family permease [Streptomyces catenulae]